MISTGGRFSGFESFLTSILASSVIARPPDKPPRR
jgi:hypothetical protein